MRRSGGWYRTTNLQGGSIENCHGMSEFWKQTTDSQSTVPASNCSFSNLTQHLWRLLSTPGVTRIVLSLPPGTPGLLLVMPTVTLLAWCLPVVPARLTLLTLPMCCHTTSSTSVSRSPPQLLPLPNPQPDLGLGHDINTWQCQRYWQDGLIPFLPQE